MRLIKTLGKNEFKDTDTGTTYELLTPTILNKSQARKLISAWLKERSEILLKKHYYGRHQKILF